jgi:hypothetical protein
MIIIDMRITAEQVPPQDVGELPEPPTGLAVDAGVQLGLDEDMPAMAPINHPAVASPAVVSPNGHAKSHSNGHGKSARVTVTAKPTSAGATQTLSLQTALGEMMGDAPLCDTCGHITVRNGSCYRCFNCGNSMGCSGALLRGLTISRPLGRPPTRPTTPTLTGIGRTDERRRHPATETGRDREHAP